MNRVRRLISRGGACAAGILATALLAINCADAGELGKAEIEHRFQRPLQVGEKLREVPAWPLTSELTPDAGPIGYVFETIDLAPIPGFEGTPINLLVAIDAAGKFIDVEVLRQHEPVFLGGLGPAPLHEFVRQYAGKTLKQAITVSNAYGNMRAGGDGNRVVLDGISKATASVRIVNQTVLAAAQAVARARLGFSDPGSGAPAAMPKRDLFQPQDFARLLKSGYVQRIALTNAEAEKLFAGSDGAGTDDEASQHPDDLFVEVYVAYLNAPSIGRNLLGDADWEKLDAYLQDGRPAFWVATRGRYGLFDENFVPGTPPPRLSLAQSALPVELRDANRDYAHAAGLPDANAALILTAPAHAGLDPGRPLEFGLTLSRAKGMILPVTTHRQITLQYLPPAELFEFPPKPLPEWLQAWRGRWPDLIAIGAVLAVLAAILARPGAISRRPRRLVAFRTGFLAFTLFVIGWYAQGQLSIVQITGAIKSLMAGAGLRSFLYDPVSLLLIAFTLVTLAVWGRGTFCGWLCPFGALQEFVAMFARALRLPQWRIKPRTARVLNKGAYVVLALLISATAAMPTAAEKMVEIEPFKTAITLGFQREWPYLAWAVGILSAGLFVYKFYCRFICPLGAALAIAGRLRYWRWIPRLDGCGKPCQKCRHACQYDAIGRDGTIDYAECFQCLDCVGIYHDTGRCAPKVLFERKGRVVPIVKVKALKPGLAGNS